MTAWRSIVVASLLLAAPAVEAGSVPRPGERPAAAQGPTGTAAQADAQSAQPPAPGAQARPDRPYRRIFGGAKPDQARRRFLDLAISLTGGYDDNLAVGVPGTISDPRYQVQGGMASGNAELSYRRGAREHDWFRTGASAGVRRYPGAAALNAAEFRGDVGFSSTLGRRVVITAAQAVARQPFLRMEAIPGLPGAALPGGGSGYDYGVAKRDSLAYNGSAEARFEVGRKTYLSPRYSLSGVEMLEGGDAGYQRGQFGGVSLTLDRWRRASMGAEYSYTTDENSYTGPLTTYRTHHAAALLGYRRLFPRQRQVSLTLRPGVAVAEIRTSSVGRYTETRPTAAASLRLDFSRTWAWSLDYERRYHYLPGFGDPFFTDDLRARVAGFLARSVDLSLEAVYSNGSVGYLERGGYASASGTAQLRVAAGRHAAATARFLYYTYEFGAGVALPPGYGRTFDRIGFRVGIDLWLPMMR